MNVLAVDTVGPVIGVALLIDGEVRERVERIQRGAEARLTPWIAELCAEAGIALTDVEGADQCRVFGGHMPLHCATTAGLTPSVHSPCLSAACTAPARHAE